MNGLQRAPTRLFHQSTTHGLRCNATRRNLQITGRRCIHIPTLAETLVWSTESISAIHATGVPWYITIPLVAVGVGSAFRFPFQYYSRQIARKRNELQPLIQAWRSRHMRTVQSSANANSTTWQKDATALSERSRSRIYKTFGVQTWKLFTPLLNIFPFVLVSESLRRLCGAQSGWIKLIESTQEDGARTGSIGEAIAKTGDLFDKTMAEGGCLWFTDLTVADPYLALPIICSLLLVRSSWGKLSRDQLRSLFSLDKSNQAVGLAGRVQQTLLRLSLLMPLMPLMVTHLPAAIFLYWASSFSVTAVTTSMLDKMLPANTTGRKRQTKSTQGMRQFLAASKSHVK